MKHFVLLCFFIYCSFHDTFAQAVSIKRIEFEFTDTMRITNYYPFANGELIERKIEKNTRKKTPSMVYTKFNSELEQTQQLRIASNKKHKLEQRCITDLKIYDMTYSLKGTYTIHEIDEASLTSKTIHGTLPKGVYISNMQVVGNFAYILGRTNKFPFVLIKNLETGAENFARFSTVHSKFFEIISFETNTNAHEVYFITKNVIKGNATFTAHIYKHDKKIQEFRINNTYSDKKYVNLNISKTPHKDNSYIVTGTYSNSSKPDNNKTIGIMIMNIEEGKEVFVTFINYLSIQNFTSYMPEKKQEKIAKRKSRSTIRGKELEMSYEIISHRIIQKNGTYILLGEAYYPTYVTVCSTTTTTSGTTTTCTQTFDGFKYTHFFVLAFNNTGEVLWSNSAPLHITEKPFIPKRFIQPTSTDNSLAVVYNSGSTIYTHTYTNGIETQQNSIHVVQTHNEDDKVKVQDFSKLEYWYQNNYILYGAQRIKNKEEEKKRRYVYYLNKIAVEL